MTFAQLNAEIRRLKKKQSNFRSNAKIQFKHLSFDDDVDHDFNELFSHLNSKNVDRLIEIFRFEKCQRFEKKHRIAITINEKFFGNFLKRSAFIKINLMQ